MIPTAAIEGIEGVYKGRRVVLRPGRISIGSGRESSLSIPSDPELSRRHALLFSDDGSWFIKDEGSGTGTFLDGKRIRRVMLIPDGGTLRIGGQTFRILYEQTSAIRARVTFNPGYVPPPPKPEEEQGYEPDYEWFGPGTTLQFHDFEIRDAMAYLGTRLVPMTAGTAHQAASREEPSLLNPQLRIEKGRPLDLVSYSPTYLQMSRRHRMSYVEWLASGRTSLVPQNYMSLFLYGLERRLLWKESPEPSPEEEEAIYAELTALCERYPDFTSARATAVRLMAANWKLRPERVALNLVDRDEFYSSGLTYKYALGCLTGHRFTVEHALQWLENERPNLERKIIAQRCWPEILAVFTERMTHEIREGIPLTASRRTVGHYRSVTNPSLHQESIRKSEVKEAEEATEILSLLGRVCLSCVVDLEAAAKRLGWSPNETERRRVQIFLPDELRRASELARAIRTELTAAVGARELRTWREFLMGIGIGEARLTKSEIRLFDLVAELGFIVEPDPRVGLLSNDKSLVFVARTAKEPVAPLSDKLRDALLVCWAAGSTLGPVRTAAAPIAETIVASFELSPAQGERVEAFARWLEREVPKPSKSAIDRLDPDHRAIASGCLLNLTRAGHQDPPVIKDLTRTLVAWGWKQRDVFSAIHADDGLVVVSEGTEFTPYAIPSPDRPAKPVALDMEKVQQKLAETEKVTRILGDVFLEEERETVVQTPAAPAEDPRMGALRKIVQALPEGEIDVAEFGRLVTGEGLMVGATVEALNDLAYEKCDAPLIHGEGPYEVDAEILEELKDGFRED